MSGQISDYVEENIRILNEPTAKSMHRQLFTQDPRVSGWAHGFVEMTLNGRRVISHGGDTVWFHTALVLFPESGVGLFVSYNSEDAADAPDELVQAFADHYYPSPEPEPPRPSSAFADQAGDHTGSYGVTRRTYSKYAKVAFMLYQVTASVAEQHHRVSEGQQTDGPHIPAEQPDVRP